MAGGMDSARLNNVNDATTGKATLTAFTTTSGAFLKLLATIGTSSAGGTEITPGGSYTTPGIAYAPQTGSNWTGATYAAGVSTGQNGVAISQTGMPAATIVGVEIWDSAATKLRWWWGPLTANITTNSGDTVTFAIAAVQTKLTG